MAGTTDNYGFRFPTDGDAQNTAVDIENLANDVDSMTLVVTNAIDVEAGTRASADLALDNEIHNIIHFGDVDHGMLIQASVGAALLDEYGKVTSTFPIPFTSPPIMIANNATRDQSVVIGVEHDAITSTQFVVFAVHIADGLPAIDTNIYYHWVAFGFRA